MKGSLILFAFIFSTAVFGQVGIGTTMPSSSAILDVRSSTKAMIVPRLSTNAIFRGGLTPEDGMIVFNTDTKRFLGYSSGGASNYISQTAKNASYSLNTGNTLSQTITPVADVRLGTIKFFVNDGLVTSMKLEIKETNPLTEVSVTLFSQGSFASGNTLGFYLASSDIMLREGKKYTLVLGNLGSILPGNPSTTVSVAYNNANVYSGGVMYIDNVYKPDYDLYFEIDQIVQAGWKALTY